MSRQAKSAISWGPMSRTCEHVVFTAVSLDVSTLTFKKFNGDIWGVKTLTENGVIAAINETFPDNKIDKLLSWEVKEEVIKRNELQFLGNNPSMIAEVKDESKESK